MHKYDLTEDDAMQSNLTMDVLETTLHCLSKRIEHTTINIANMNTPKYGRREISFESQLRDVIEGPSKLPLSTTDPAHISNVTRGITEVEPKQFVQPTEVYRGDSNNVDPETEIALLTESRMLYDAMAMRMGGKFRSLRRVMTAPNQG